MSIINQDALDTALASGDKKQIEQVLSTLSSGVLSKEEIAALNLSRIMAYVNTMNAYNKKYKAFLEATVEGLEKTDKAIGNREDKDRIEEIKKSL